MKKLVLLLGVLMLMGNITIAQEKLYLVIELMHVDNEQEAEYAETEAFWEKIHEQRVKGGHILGWDLWALSPGGEDQGYQYATVTLFNDPVKMMDGASWSSLMDWTKAAHPDMSEANLTKKLNHSSKTRDLAVRIFAEEIDVTEGNFDMALGTVATFDMMKVSLENYAIYEKAESEIFKPLHQKEVTAGNKGSWGLLRFISPIGSDTYASHMTVNMYKDHARLFNQNINFAEANTAEQTEVMQKGLASRDMKYVYVAQLIRKVR